MTLLDIRNLVIFLSYNLVDFDFSWYGLVKKWTLKQEAVMGTLLRTTIGDLFDEVASRFPDREALIDLPRGRRYSYQELLIIVNRLARGFLKLGIRRRTPGPLDAQPLRIYHHRVCRGEDRRHPDDPGHERPVAAA